MIFFLAWPVISIGVSVTFFIFFILLRSIRKDRIQIGYGLSKQNLPFYLFMWVAFFSLIFAPWEVLQDFNSGDIIILSQYIYWMLVSIFFIKIFPRIDFTNFNKIVYIGLSALIINFFFFNFKLPLPFLDTWISRNGFVFSLLAFWPFASAHIYTKFGKRWGNISLLLILAIMVLTDGRAGLVIVFLENLLLFLIFNARTSKVLRFAFIVLLPFMIFLAGDINTASLRDAIGNQLMSYSQRLGEFVKGEGVNGDLTVDKSWLTRELMIEKGNEIISEYPALGVGVGHFTNYKSSLDNLFTDKYSRLTGGVYDEDYYNTRSAHNSYVHILSEMGLIGFFTLIWILIRPLKNAIRCIIIGNLNSTHISYVALIGMCIHFYAITSIPSTISWVVIGIASGRAAIAKQKK